MPREFSERIPGGPPSTRDRRWQWLNGTQPLGELPLQRPQQQVAPVALHVLVDGIDINSDNDVPAWNVLLNAGFKFVFLK